MNELAKRRTGARSFLNVLKKACDYSHIPGFRLGLNTILGASTTDDLYVVWTPLCNFVDGLIGLDNWYNKKDQTNDDGDGEDVSPAL